MLNPETLKKLRNRANMSQQALADASGVTKRTIARLEAGENARGSTMILLAEALGTKPETLAEAPDAEVVREKEADLLELSLRQVKLPLVGDTIISYDLIEERYGVRMLDIVNAAPLLFTLLAEMSLADRRRRAEEAEEALNAFNRVCPEHLTGRGWEGYGAEKKSIAERDLFGHSIDWMEANEFYYAEERNPFADFLTELAKELDPANDAIDPEEIDFNSNGFSSAPLFRKIRNNLTGGSFRAHFALTRGFARIKQIPPELRGEDTTPERVKWLEKTVPDDVFAEYESWWKDSLKISFDPDESTKEGDENV